MELLGWIFSGLIVGAVARLLMPGRQPIGFLMTIVLGIVGSIVGGAAGWFLFGDPGQGFRNYLDESFWTSFAFSVLGAVLILWIVVAASRERQV
jgi:uncharacterized membrane protein YeaQ/YmgE (transglycosylase-associated protein family)